MRRWLKFFGLALLGAILFLIAIIKAGPVNLGRVFALLFNFQGLLLAAITILAAYFGIWRSAIVLRSYGHKLAFWPLAALWLAGFGAGYALPVNLGGDIVKAYFTKKKFDFLSWERVIAASGAERILDATMFFVFLVGGLAIFALKSNLAAYLSVGVLVVLGLVTAGLILFYFKAQRKEGFLQWFFNFFGLAKSRFFRGQSNDVLLGAEKEMLQFFHVSKVYFWQGLAVSFLRYLALFGRVWLLLFLVTGHIGLFKALAIFGFTLVGFLSPVPASLGTLELSVGLGFQGLGLGFASGAVFSMILRIVDLLLCLVGLAYCAKFALMVAERRISSLFKVGRGQTPAQF
ncbi:MAG: lysylphosphatidylglycerol synthase transmembrane domain-containing protein [Patescibacteria group bacterium]